MRNIFVNGFPHCGTTILLRLLGSCRGCTAHKIETRDPRPVPGTRVIFKWPYLDLGLLGSNDSVLVVRNPWFTFPSILERGIAVGRFKGHNVDDYIRTGVAWLNPPRGCRTIRYEDMFDPDHPAGVSGELLALCGDLGVELPLGDLEARKATERPQMAHPRSGHAPYREWQVAQPLSDRNPSTLPDIPAWIDEKLSGSSVVRDMGYTRPPEG